MLNIAKTFPIPCYKGIPNTFNFFKKYFLFYFILFYFILFYFILFYFILFYFTECAKDNRD